MVEGDCKHIKPSPDRGFRAAAARVWLCNGAEGAGGFTKTRLFGIITRYEHFKSLRFDAGGIAYMVDAEKDVALLESG